jgi:hypothetical protein
MFINLSNFDFIKMENHFLGRFKIFSDFHEAFFAELRATTSIHFLLFNKKVRK